MSANPWDDAARWLTLWRDLGVEEVRPAPRRPAAGAMRDGGAVALPGARVTGVDDPAAALAALRDDTIGDCRRCRLCEGRQKIVFGVGNPQAELVFVGEGPGADEDRQGEPFVGRAGQLLDKIIAAMGRRREDVYIANVVKCRPPENRTPNPDEAQTCLPFLREQLRIIAPRVIVALGGTALGWLTGEADVRITRVRGRWYEVGGIPVKATFHPAYLLRNAEAKRPVWDDMQDVMSRLG